jgi:hypothetical protein
MKNLNTIEYYIAAMFYVASYNASLKALYKGFEGYKLHDIACGSMFKFERTYLNKGK